MAVEDDMPSATAGPELPPPPHVLGFDRFQAARERRLERLRAACEPAPARLLCARAEPLSASEAAHRRAMLAHLERQAVERRAGAAGEILV
jgi:hypothetical protein